MGRRKFFDFIQFSCRNSVWILAFCWVIGICLGLIIGSDFDPDVLSLMRMTSESRVSIVGLLLNLLPFVLSAAAVHYSFPGAFFLLATGKGLCHGFCMFLILAEFSSAGWLLYRLLMFTDSILLIPLFFFWARHIDGSRNFLKRDTWLCLGISLIAGALDYFVISPLIITAMKHS